MSPEPPDSIADVSGAFDSLPREVQAAIDRFFDTRESGLMMLARPGEEGWLDVRKSEDASAPLLSRVSILERTLLDHLDLAAQKHDEIDSYGEEYATQLRGEVVSTLIALRELWRCVPELRL
jgi:hypothetical protein